MKVKGAEDAFWVFVMVVSAGLVGAWGPAYIDAAFGGPEEPADIRRVEPEAHEPDNQTQDEEGPARRAIREEEMCPERYTLGAPRVGVQVVVVADVVPFINGFYEAADEVFPDHDLLPPVGADGLEEAWGMRESVYHDVLVLGDVVVESDKYDRPAWGWICGPRALVGVYPEECPWRAAVHELGHLLGYGHEDGGVMGPERCDMDPPGGAPA